MRLYGEVRKKEKRSPTAVNEMGEAAYQLSPKEKLVATVLTTFLHDKYYEKETDVVARILEAADKTDAEFVARPALYARHEGNMRSASHLLAGYLPKRLSGTAFARRFYRSICVRPDNASEIFAFYQSTEHQGNMPNAMREGFKAYLESLDVYRIDKYKDNVERFETAKQVRMYLGLVPSENSSGERQRERAADKNRQSAIAVFIG